MTTLYSSRNHPLIWHGGHPEEGVVLTMECYCKWYDLQLVYPDRIEAVDFGVLYDHCKNEAPSCDHAPNPRAVYRYAAAKGFQIDNEAFEMMIGRWELEYHENYLVECEDGGPA
jgi:hypothetical protein